MTGPLQIGVVGLGRGFTLTLPALRAHPAVRLRGAFDMRADATALFAEQFGARAYPSLDAMLADAELDAVYVATPHELHASQSIRALAAGKHVLVEKPMATTVVDAAAMVRAAQAAGRALVVGPSHGFDAPVLLAAELIASGAYGAVRMVTALNFTDFLYRPRRPEELGAGSAGGVVFSQAAHQIDVVRRLVGRDVATVRALLGDWDPTRPGIGAYQSLMTFAGGASASLTYGGYAHYDSDELMGWSSELGHPKDPAGYGGARRALARLALPGAEAAAKARRGYGAGIAAPPVAPNHEHFGFVLASCERADLLLKPTGIEVFGDEQRTRIPLASPDLPRAAVIDEFVDAATGRRPAVQDGAWGLTTMASCSALLASGRLGREVGLDGIDSRITEEPFNDPAAPEPCLLEL